jgi:hypothetical protein
MAEWTKRPRIESGKGIEMNVVWAFLWLCLMPISIGLVFALTVGMLAGALVTLGVLLTLAVWQSVT